MAAEKHHGTPQYCPRDLGLRRNFPSRSRIGLYQVGYFVETLGKLVEGS
jgi:hypothetical protein